MPWSSTNQTCHPSSSFCVVYCLCMLVWFLTGLVYPPGCCLKSIVLAIEAWLHNYQSHEYGWHFNVVIATWHMMLGILGILIIVLCAGGISSVHTCTQLGRNLLGCEKLSCMWRYMPVLVIKWRVFFCHNHSIQRNCKLGWSDGCKSHTMVDCRFHINHCWPSSLSILCWCCLEHLKHTKL